MNSTPPTRTLWVPLEFHPDDPVAVPYQLQNGFHLARQLSPDWLKEEKVFLSKSKFERLKKKEWWLCLHGETEAAIGDESQEGMNEIDRLLFATSLNCPCVGMFPPIFVIEQADSQPTAWIRTLYGLHDEENLCLPGIFRRNYLRLAHLKEAANLIHKVEALSNESLPFQIAGTLWTVSFKQHPLGISLIFSVISIEALLGSHDRKSFLDRLGCMLNLHELCYPQHEFDFEIQPGLLIDDIIKPIYDARGQIAHGDEVSPGFLEGLKTKPGKRALVERASGDRVEILEILMEASRLLLQKLLLLVLRDPNCSFLVEDGKSKDQRFKALITNGRKLRSL